MKLLRFFRLPSLCLCSFVSWFSFPSLPVAMDASCSYTPLPFHSLPRLLLLLPPPPPSFSSSQCALFCCVPLIPRPLRILADSTTSHFHNLPTRVRVSQRIGQSSPVRAVPVQVAHELLNAGHRFLDVRTAEEFAQGHIEGAVNIPYMYKVGSGMAKNIRFLANVSEQFELDDEVLVGCQMGKRSQMAVLEMMTAGYTGVLDMAGGYLAWVQSGMPIKDASN